MTRSHDGFELSGVDGRTFRVEGEGKGEMVLLVHGGSNGPSDWDRVARQLAKTNRVLRYTRFTYRSDPPPSGRDAMVGEVHDVLAVAEAVGVPVVAIGHSSGGIVVLESALAASDRFSGMLLYEPPVAVEEPLGGDALKRARRAVEAGHTDRAVRIFLHEIVEVPGWIVGGLKLVRPLWRRLREYAPAQIADTEAIESLGVGLERYEVVRVPAMLLGGGFLSPAHARSRLDALAKALPVVDSKVTMKWHGHGAYYTAPGKIARIIGGFVERVTAEAPGRAASFRV